MTFQTLYVFPVPVCPYAKSAAFSPACTASNSGTATSSTTVSSRAFRCSPPLAAEPFSAGRSSWRFPSESVVTVTPNWSLSSSGRSVGAKGAILTWHRIRCPPGVRAVRTAGTFSMEAGTVDVRCSDRLPVEGGIMPAEAGIPPRPWRSGMDSRDRYFAWYLVERKASVRTHADRQTIWWKDTHR
eukprot:scaffold61251_cov57-Phaeocystis_antarctica.AAC.1